MVEIPEKPKDPAADFEDREWLESLSPEQLGKYNETLAKADALLDEIQATERSLSELTERSLLAVGAKWGKDSPQYKAAGGTRRSETKRTKKVEG